MADNPSADLRVGRADRALVQLSTWTEALASVQERFASEFGFALPDGPRRTGSSDLIAIGLGPGRWLVASGGSGEVLRERLASALEGIALATDQSDARAVFRVEGSAMAALVEIALAIDAHPRSFPPDGAAVTEMALMSAIVWRDGPEALLIAVPRSMEVDAGRLLEEAAAAIRSREQAVIPAKAGTHG